MSNGKNMYSLGDCIVCRKNRPLKYGKCNECQKKVDIPDIFKDIFRGFMDNKSDDKNKTKKKG